MIIDERLSLYVCRVYARDLQTKPLKDIQPQICQSMDSLLGELNTQEESQINCNRSVYNKRKDRSRFNYKQDERNFKQDERNSSHRSTGKVSGKVSQALEVCVEEEPDDGW